MTDKESVPFPPADKTKTVNFEDIKGKNDLSSNVKKPAFGLLRFRALKIIFVDLLVEFGDLGSDLAQGI